MSSSLCGGKFQNTFYRFDSDANIYQYNNVTSVAEHTSTSISSETDSVTSIKKCVYNGANAIYFIGITEEDPDVVLYSAEFDNVSQDFTFQKLPDPTNGLLNLNSTILLPIDHWKGLRGCVMLGYNKSSLGVACPNKASIKVFSNLNYGISTTKNLYTADDNQLFQLTAEGIKGFPVTVGEKLSSIAISNSSSTVYKFQKPNMIDSNVVWKISTSEDSLQVLFYNTGPSFQLIKLDKETSTANSIDNSFNNLSPKSVVLFQNSSLFILNDAAYQTVPINQVIPASSTDKNIPTSASTSSSDVISMSADNKIDPAVAGGFTMLGIFIGVLLASLVLFLLLRYRRNKEISSQRIYVPIDSPAAVEEILPSQVETVKSTDIPPVYANNIVRRSSFKAQLIPTNIGEGDPTNTKYSSIFNNRCQLLPNLIGDASSNPQHQSRIYIRECTFQGNSALIHYFKSSDGEKKFENAMQALQSPLMKPNNNHIVRYFDAVQLKKTTSADNGFKFIMITSFYEPKKSLAALYKPGNDNIVDVLDETFIVYTIYSLLLSVRDLHASGYVHRGLSENAFYAANNAPTTDWILADFDEAGLVSATYSVPPSKCEYYDTMYDGKTYEYATDIWALGVLLFKVISGGQSVNMGNTTDYSDCIEQQIQGKEFSEQYRSLLNSTLCNTPYTMRLNAQQLVELWESRFDFGY